MKTANRYLSPFRPHKVKYPKIGDWFCDKHTHTMIIIPDDSPTYCPDCYGGMIARVQSRRATLRRNKLIQELLKGSEGHSNGQGSKIK